MGTGVLGLELEPGKQHSLYWEHREEQDTNSPSSPWHSKGLLLLYRPFAVGSKQIIEIHMFSPV